jgi:hypothetical protein
MGEDILNKSIIKHDDLSSPHMGMEYEINSKNF